MRISFRALTCHYNVKRIQLFDSLAVTVVANVFHHLALRIVLSRIEQEKRETYQDVQTNVEKIIKPILQSLAVQLPASQRNYISMIQTNLEEITSPFINQFSRAYQALTPTEIAVCNMVRTGMRTKEIAELRGISESTVNRHREKIRRKLNITNQDINLATFLQSTMT